jgi:hypothetical protein
MDIFDIEDNIKELVEKISRTVNVMGYEKETTDMFYQEFVKMHPTLQASFVRMFIGFCKLYADIPYCDLRNKAAVEFAKRISDMDGIYIPFV